MTLAYATGVASACGQERLVRRILEQHPELVGIKGLPKRKSDVNCIYGLGQPYLEEHTTLGEYLLIWAIKICDLLVSLGAQDYEVPCIDYDEMFHAEASGETVEKNLGLGREALGTI
ncbi:hypothetical protein MAPG_06242 [Magnaporthiopsis poae ATCC 64411]|uniref:Uncharacterized protein n=1 Tax=Magnaporthiopsis poae (strain ATCC 64411 / 73-15) TaxID=644358 RepID=A0A0C4E1I1_MAGP6|nr:hypothetical protein MAPG_06242 [Magnaporthiopsis poae ATCC 64411]